MAAERKQVALHTDGSCLGNPGAGGFGLILEYGGNRKELSGGYLLTTNNRMEMLAVIRGLEALREPCEVTVFSDSKYVVDAITLGWAARWRSNGWRRGRSGVAKNPDLWGRLLGLCAHHHVRFRWVKGHAGDPDNERCDLLARNAASGADLQPDEGYDSA